MLALPLGGNQSQMNAAIHLKPTAVFVWAGNNDALAADIAGTPAVMTPPSTFSQEFQQLITTLHTQTKATLIVANMPDVTLVPYLTPAALILAEVSAASGLPQAVVSALLGIQPGDLVNTTGLAQVQAAIAALKQGHMPSSAHRCRISQRRLKSPRCSPPSINTTPRSRSRYPRPGAILVDMHASFESAAQNGVTINNFPPPPPFLEACSAWTAFTPRTPPMR